MSSSDGAWPPRRYGWRAELEDGTVVDELPVQGPPMNKWDDLDLEAVDVLHVVDHHPDGEGEVVSVLAGSGVVSTRGEALRFGVAGAPFPDGPVDDLVQWKRGYSEYRNGVGQSSGLLSITVGYRREFEAIVVEPKVTLHVGDARLGLEVRMAGAGVEEDDLEVYLGPDQVTTEEEFRRRVGPPAPTPAGEAPLEGA